MSDPHPEIPKFDIRSLVLFFWENLAVIKRNWILFTATIIVCGVAVGYVVRQLDSRQIDILTSDNNLLKDHNNTLLQTATAVLPSQWRRLTDSERAQLLAALKRMPQLQTIFIYAIAETEPRQYASQFADAFRGIGIKVQPREVSGFMNVPDVGLMVGITTFPTPSPEAQKFKNALADAGLDVHFTQWVSQPETVGNTQIDYDLYVGPKPW
jgi:hypothetical protein